MGISHVKLIKLEKTEKDQKILNDFYSRYMAKNDIKTFN